MRIRNNKINVFLNNEEKLMLIEKSNKANLSQSGFLRLLITEYYPSKLTKADLDNIVKSLLEIVDNLSLLKKHLEFSRYSDYSNYVDKQISNIKEVINHLWINNNDM